MFVFSMACCAKKHVCANVNYLFTLAQHTRSRITSTHSGVTRIALSKRKRERESERFGPLFSLQKPARNIRTVAFRFAMSCAWLCSMYSSESQRRRSVAEECKARKEEYRSQLQHFFLFFFLCVCDVMWSLHAELMATRTYAIPHPVYFRKFQLPDGAWSLSCRVDVQVHICAEVIR